MTTFAERAVIEAAMSWDWTPSETAKLIDLKTACGALRAERAAEPAPAAKEQSRPWSEVVTEDEIYSTKTKKWYRVVSTVLHDGLDRTPDQRMSGRAMAAKGVKVTCEGMAKPFTVPADGEVLVRRSEMGQAVDTWIDVMRSGPA